MKPFILMIFAIILLCNCVSTRNGAGSTLQNAIEQSADKIAADLKAKSAVAVVAFESVHDNLSAHIMEELNGALFDRGMVVIEREKLEYVQKELNYQLSGNVSDESAARIGRFFGAELVVDGRLIDLGDSYRYQVNAVHVETATRGSVARLDVANNSSMRRMVAALANQTTSVRVARYAVTEQTRPQTATEYLNKGIMYAMQGNYSKAITEFDEALRINPNLVGAYMLRARALAASVSRVTAVEENFSGVIISANREPASAELVRIYDLAISDYTQAIRLDPTNAFAYTSRGNSYAAKGDYERAIEDHTEAIKLNPDDYVAYSNRGLVYSIKGDLDQAIVDYTRSIRLEPDFAIAYYGRGVAYQNNGDFDRAIADFTQTIRLDPDISDAYSNRGLAYGAKGDLDRAIADFTQTIRLDANVADAYSNRGLAYQYMGDLDKAISDYSQAIQLNPNLAVSYLNRGNAYYLKSNYDQAISDYTQVIRLDPNDTVAYGNRGAIYAIRGDLNRAVSDLEMALRINPNDFGVRQNLEKVRQMQGF